MKNTFLKYLLPLFIIFQLVIVTQMVWQHAFTSQKGKEFRFRCAMYDPVHPFAGRYMRLNFNDLCVRSEQPFTEDNDMAYVTILKGDDGFAEPGMLSTRRPENTADYLEIAPDQQFMSYGRRDSCVRFRYPFDKFYLPEEDAPRAEKMVNEALRDTSVQVWVSVSIYRGNAVIRDVFIGERSLNAMLDD